MNPTNYNYDVHLWDAAKCWSWVKFNSSVPLKSIVWGYVADLSTQRAAFMRAQ